MSLFVIFAVEYTYKEIYWTVCVLESCQERKLKIMEKRERAALCRNNRFLLHSENILRRKEYDPFIHSVVSLGRTGRIAAADEVKGYASENSSVVPGMHAKMILCNH